VLYSRGLILFYLLIRGTLLIKSITAVQYMQPTRALLLLALSAFLWSTSGLFIKLIDLNPLAIAGIRSLIAGTFMLIALRGSLHFHFSFPQVAGALAYSLTMIFFVSATKMTTAANAILLQYTAPVFTALLAAWLLKEKVTRFDWAIIGIVIGGMMLFFLDQLSLSGFWGNILGASSGLTLSFFILFMRMQKESSTIETVILGNLTTAILCLPFFFQQAPTAVEWGILFYMGILQIGLSFVIFSTAIKFVPALDAILIQALDPLLNPVWVFLVIGEVPGRWAMLGGFIVLTAVTIRNIYISRSKNARAAGLTKAH